MRGSGANALIRIPLHSFRLALAAVVVGGMTAQHAEAQTEAQRVVEVVDAYHAALVNGDSTAALSLLSEDVDPREWWSRGQGTLQEWPSGR